jgi:hypothetical protein
LLHLIICFFFSFLGVWFFSFIDGGKELTSWNIFDNIVLYMWKKTVCAPSLSVHCATSVDTLKEMHWCKWRNNINLRFIFFFLWWRDSVKVNEILVQSLLIIILVKLLINVRFIFIFYCFPSVQRSCLLRRRWQSLLKYWLND